MKKHFLITLIGFIVCTSGAVWAKSLTSDAGNARIASMYAMFRGHSDNSGHVFEIKQAGNGKWSYVEYKSCNYNPCESSAERLKSVTSNPLIISPANMTDGGFQIRLDKHTEIRFVNYGLPLPPELNYYEMLISDDDGTVTERIKLNFDSILEHQ